MMVSSGLPAGDLRMLLGRRQCAVENSLQDLRAERDRLTKHGYMNAAVQAVFAHWEERFEAELRWHARLDPLIDDLAKGSIATTMPVSESAPQPPESVARKRARGPTRGEKKPTTARKKVRNGAK
jgi:hypothetical protein